MHTPLGLRDWCEWRLAVDDGEGVSCRQDGHRRPRLDRRRAQVRDQHRLLELDQAGMDGRLVLEHVQPGAGDRPVAERRRPAPPRPRPAPGWCSPGTPRGFISASRRASIRWWVSGVSGQCSETTSAVASSSSSSSTHSRVELRLQLRGHAGAGRCRRSACRRPAPGAPSPCRSGRGRRSPSVFPWMPVPSRKNMLHVQVAASAHQPLALAQPAGGHQDQRECDVGGRLGQHPGRVREDDAVPAAGLDVGVVVADRDVRHDPQAAARRRPGARRRRGRGAASPARPRPRRRHAARRARAAGRAARPRRRPGSPSSSSAGSGMRRVTTIRGRAAVTPAPAPAGRRMAASAASRFSIEFA